MGYDTADDAAVYELSPDMALIQTVDIFPPAVDDPYEYGLIAAANSLSDVWAMGGEPRLCMNILMFPDSLPPEAVNAILRGGCDKVAEAGAILVGGHTLKDDIPKYGLCVSGLVPPNRILRNNTVREGDVLILTKPLGTGILTTADRGGLLTRAEHQAMVRSMTTLNKYAADAVRSLDGIHACTDVTGFSLLGHSFEMCAGTGLTAVIDSARVPLLPGADTYASMGLVPAAAYQNMGHLKEKVSLPGSLASHIHDLLFDPQTSGGLLYSVARGEAGRIMEAILKACPEATVIGHVERDCGFPVTVL